jgi:hypothetical protein
MRCPDCAKFVGYDTEQEPELESEQVDGTLADGYTFSASVRRVLACAECGNELKESSFDIEIELKSEELKAKCPKADEDADGAHTLEVTDYSVSATERTETKDRHGKPIKSARYMKTFYGFEGEATVTCEGCELEEIVHFEDESQASFFEEV